MSTNGLVSVLDGDGKTRIKILVGCEGMNAQAFADALRECGDYSFASVRTLASGFRAGPRDPFLTGLGRRLTFGCEDCIVMIERDEDGKIVVHSAYDDLGADCPHYDSEHKADEARAKAAANALPRSWST